MKITDFAIIFVIIIFPIFLISGYHVGDQKEVQLLQMKYTSALRTAAQDAGRVLNMNELQELEAGYQSDKYFRADKQLALQVFMQTLYLNLDIEDDPAAQEALKLYVPAVVIVDYDGYYVYAADDYVDSQGMQRSEYLWSAKKPYAYSDSSGNSIHFTLDQRIEAFDIGSRQWIQGLRAEAAAQSSIPLLHNSELFEQVRRATIVNSIQDDLAYMINRHNEVAARNGISYTFTLPSIPEEEWNNSIQDIGVMAFIQGIPVGDQYINDYALGGGRLVRTPDIYAAVDDVTGIKYYYRESCAAVYNYRVEEIYYSAKEAAANGYFEKDCSLP